MRTEQRDILTRALTPEKIVALLRESVAELPERNQQILCLLVSFFRALADSGTLSCKHAMRRCPHADDAEKSKMNEKNIGIIFGMSLIRSGSLNMELVTLQALFVELLVVHAYEVFPELQDSSEFLFFWFLLSFASSPLMPM